MQQLDESFYVQFTEQGGTTSLPQWLQHLRHEAE